MRWILHLYSLLCCSSCGMPDVFWWDFYCAADIQSHLDQKHCQERNCHYYYCSKLQSSVQLHSRTNANLPAGEGLRKWRNGCPTSMPCPRARITCIVLSSIALNAAWVSLLHCRSPTISSHHSYFYTGDLKETPDYHNQGILPIVAWKAEWYQRASLTGLCEIVHLRIWGMISGFRGPLNDLMLKQV